VPCPPGYLPRAALGALIAPLFVAVFRSGLALGAHAQLEMAQQQLARRRDKCKPQVEAPANPARELARLIGRTVPLVYGGGALGAVAAYRWKCDVNENAKAPAFSHFQPELGHNEICAWGQHGDVTRQLITLVELRHGFEHDRLGPRFDATREEIEETVHQVHVVEAEGEGRLAQLLDLMYMGDFVSCYLALDNDVDPGPIDAIFELKRRLAAHS
jgi:glucose/mannose-6-phosphate isomerase